MKTKKSQSQKKADAAFIEKVKTIGVITGSALKKLAAMEGVPEKIEVDGETYTLKSATPCMVEVTMQCVKKHDDSGEESLAA